MIPVIVRNVVQEADGVVRLVLGSKDGSALPSYEAGAHIDIRLPSGLVRQYSLCRMQSQAEYYEIAVLKDPESRGGSIEVHSLEVGDEVSISAPRNHFSLAKSKRKAVLIAGGIGVTPLLPMAQQLNKMGLPFEFHYCAKSPQTAAFAKALEAGSFSDKMHFHFSQVPTSGRMDVVNVLSQHTMDADLYVCGPADFISYIIQQAENLGWPDDRLHREYFTAPALSGEDVENSAFQVKINSSGELLDVPEDQTIFQVLENNGIFIPVSCESGVCGTCQTSVISGTPDHRDVFLTDKEHSEGKLVMPCCSRSKSPILELDL